LLSSALNVKQDVETRRSKNELGILIWQLNEIWPTGGWGSIEYGTSGFTAGQVLGGRWKPLHYFYRRSVFADVIASCGVGGACYVKNDMAGEGFFGDVEIRSLEFASGNVTVLETSPTSPFQLAAGAGVSQRFTVNLAGLQNTTHLLIAVVYPYCVKRRRCTRAELAAKHGEGHSTTNLLDAVAASAESGAVSSNEILLAPPKDLRLPQSTVTTTIASQPNADGTIDIRVHATATALFVTLTTLAQGRFSDNSFALPPGETKITFIPIGMPDRPLLAKSLRVEHLQENL